MMPEWKEAYDIKKRFRPALYITIRKNQVKGFIPQRLWNFIEKSEIIRNS
jgi:hypothetical protein